MKETATAMLRGLVVQSEVVHAILLRETRTRFGKTRFGYMWALLDPVLVILTFWGFALVLNRTPPPGMDAFSFLATGILPFRLFQSSATQVGESINGNKALLFYPRVLPIDLVIARVIFEAVTYGTVFLVLMSAHALYFQQIVVHSPLHVIFGMISVALLGSAMGLVFCSLGVLSTSVDRARGPLLRPLFWVSGVFFTVAQLPTKVQSLALLNPIVHGIELVRFGWFPDHRGDFANPIYLWQWIMVTALFGLLLERAVRRRIQLS